MKKRIRCEECGGKTIHKKVDFSMYGISLGKFPAEVCTKCGEEVFTEEVSDQIEKITKQKGLYGLEARTKVGVAGNSLDVRIGKKVARFFGLKKGEEVLTYPESKHKLVIEIS
jgi:YgiT-type zinc finger domain-containing protein